VPYWSVGRHLAPETRAQRVSALLAAVAGKRLTPSGLETHSLELAGELFDLAQACVDPEERARRRRLSRLLGDPKGQLLSVLLTDRVARDKTFEHSAEQVSYLVARLGVPKFMTPAERMQLMLGSAVGSLAPHLTGKLIARHIREEVEGLVFPIEPALLRSYLEKRRAEGISVNVNQLGEEVLGEALAVQRLGEYIALLERPEVETISVKLSSIYSQIDLFAWQSTQAFLAERLRPIYRAAKRFAKPKLVYLDMEAYKDLRLTLDLFRSLLDEPEFYDLTAGIVLQAYIPDSFGLQRELITWAIERRRRGGAPIRLRIVKGANLAAERVHSSRMGWALPIYGSKHEVDANYKRMLLAATEPEAALAVRLGIASHNLFDLALGLILRSSAGVEDEVGFEVLEGMANSVQKALSLIGAPVLTYAPAVGPAEMDSAVAYLIRRLDENTAPENFLRHAFSMRRGDAAFEAQAERFRRALAAVSEVGDKSARSPDRFALIEDLPRSAPFANEPDTDFSVAAHRETVTHALAELGRTPCFEIGSRIGGVRSSAPAVAHGFDPSRPRMVPYRCQLARSAELERAVSIAKRAMSNPRAHERREVVRRVAALLRRRRAELIAAMVLDAGKRVVEADAEVSEAIDFAEYYWRQAEALEADAAVRARPKGVVLVTSPWNFPLAIPLSGVLAGYLANNSVIFKPALETAFVGERLASLLWEAGMPEDVLAFILCRDEDGSLLLRHPDVAAVVLTGATSTASFFLEQRPGLDLHAETGGKNAFIISALADRELAIRDLIASAFGHAGQKCSAASLAILVGPVHDDIYFREQLRDAADSLAVGSAWDPASVVTPLIRPPGPALWRALTELEAGESWLLAPRCHPDNPCLWSPGIKLGVEPGSFSHQTELFGPLLSVLRADDLEHAIDIANATPYGLTAGLHSLDEREQARFIERMHAGNLYVNRTTVGAIVGRQPFGGHKASSVGPGAKAGGPNYVLELSELTDVAREPDDAAFGAAASLPAAVRAVLEWAGGRLVSRDAARVRARVHDYQGWRERHFKSAHSTTPVLGQDNVLIYRTVGPLLLVAAEGSTPVDVISALSAALLSGCEVELSLSASGVGALAAREFVVLGEAARVPTHIEDPNEISVRLDREVARYQRVRWLSAGVVQPPDALSRAAAASGCHVSTRPVLAHGRYELLAYHREQTISIDYHRYGHLGFRSEGLGEVAGSGVLQSSGLKINSSATFSPSGPADRGP
jgi:RHH-type transcriptional regulator, proline utilization regulon repressor / proline dehydrogenase / delta 1-pyrroline-5-carboxylate dehydrogenase